MLSVVVPIYNEEKYIEQCMSSILQQDYPKEDLEIIFVDGMSRDKTREIVKKYMERFPYIKLLDNPQKIVPVAMNIGIKKSKGDIIMRLDAHSSYPTNYFSILSQKLIELAADNVGVACRTDVLNKNKKTLAIREVLGNKLGVGNSIFRLGVKKVMEVDTVPFGCWRRDVFDRYGLYNEHLIRNQDIELNKRIVKGGGRIFIIPDTYCVYYARETFKALAKNNYENGKWNILTVYFTKQLSSLSLRHFVPLLFLLSLLLPVIASFFWFPLIYLALASFIAYMVLLSIISLKILFVKKLNYFYLIFCFIVLHVSYGCGSLNGILKIFFTK